MTAGLVGQNQITTFTTPVNGTSPIDANTVRGNDNTIKTSYDAHDNDSTIHFQSSTNAARPAAGTAGRKWLDNDTYRVYYDDSAAWNEIAYLPTSGGTVSGNVTITGTLGVTGNFAVNTNKFNVTAASGNTTVAGTLGVTGATTLAAVSATTGTFSGVVSLANGTASAPSLTFSSDVSANTGIYWVGENTIGFTAGTVQSFRLDNTGVVVTGTAIISGAVTLSAGLGVAGAVVSTSGGQAIKLVATASGTYGSGEYLGWYRADATTVRAYLGFTSNNDQNFLVSTQESGDALVFQTNNTTALTLNGTTQAATFAQAITVSAGGIAVTGNSTITGTLTALTGITSSGTAALATVTASGTLTVTGVATMNGVLELTTAATSRSANVLGLGNGKQTTVGAAGGGDALPANPVGYILVYIGSTQYAIPYFNH